MNPAKEDRNRRLFALVMNGRDMAKAARIYKLTRQRVKQVVDDEAARRGCSAPSLRKMREKYRKLMEREKGGGAAKAERSGLRAVE